MTNGTRENYTAILVIDLDLGNGDRTHCGTCKMLQGRGFVDFTGGEVVSNCMLFSVRTHESQLFGQVLTTHGKYLEMDDEHRVLRCEECLEAEQLRTGEE